MAVNDISDSGWKYGSAAYTNAVSINSPNSTKVTNQMNNIFQNILQLASTTKTTRLSQNLNATGSMDDIFVEASNTYGVPVNLLKAVAKAESDFQADEVSPAGAIGVMQLMPATAQSLGVTDPYDARSNIMGGAKYLAQKLQQYNGNVELTLAAYNAGSGNVAKYGGVPPFTETQNYIKRVMAYAQESLHADQNIIISNSDATSNSNNLTGYAGTTGLSKEMCLYMIEMMKAQLQMHVHNSMDLTDLENDN